MLLVAMAMAGCGDDDNDGLPNGGGGVPDDKYERVFKEGISVLEDLRSTIRDIRDLDSAGAARGELNGLHGRARDLRRRMEALLPPVERPPDDQRPDERPEKQRIEELRARYGPRSETLVKDIKSEVARIRRLGPIVDKAAVPLIEAVINCFFNEDGPEPAPLRPTGPAHGVPGATPAGRVRVAAPVEIPREPVHGPDPKKYESLLVEEIEVMGHLRIILEHVRDMDSAMIGKGKLQRMAQRFRQLRGQIQGLSWRNTGASREIGDKYAPRITEAFLRVRREKLRIEKLGPAVNALIDPQLETVVPVR